jgi:hypothetical protein
MASAVMLYIVAMLLATPSVTGFLAFVARVHKMLILLLVTHTM